MTTQADVLNDALEHLGEPPATGPDDDTVWVVRLTNAYDREVKKLFEGHPWNFANTLVQLAAVDPTPDGWTYGYTKPAKCKRIVKVAASTIPSCNEIDYLDQGGRILADPDTVYLTYVDGEKIDSPGMWPEVFAGALAAQLAWKVCPVTGTSDTRKEELRKTARRTLMEAKLWDAQQNGPFVIPPGEYERARGGFNRRYNG
jgi:hypothetical protein